MSGPVDLAVVGQIWPGGMLYSSKMFRSVPMRSGCESWRVARLIDR